MKVAELIEILKLMDQTADVRVAHNTGNYWNTVITPEVTSVSVENITFSPYSDEFRIVDEDEVEFSTAVIIK